MRQRQALSHVKMLICWLRTKCTVDDSRLADWTVAPRPCTHILDRVPKGHARGGTLVLRNEDLDPYRSRREYVAAMIEDLRWLGVEWQEGPDVGGPYAPYSQSERRAFYLDAWRKLWEANVIYPCVCSRKELSHTTQAPHENDDEPLYPGTCRAVPARRTRLLE